MKCWVVSDAGDQWCVKLDVRDLSGHIDSTLRARAATIGFRMFAVLPRVGAVAVLPLDFIGRLRILRTLHLLAALHGAEASLVSLSGCVGSGLPFVRLLCLVVFVWLTLALF